MTSRSHRKEWWDVKRSVLVTLACFIAATILILTTGIRTTAQVRPYTPPKAESGGDWSKRIEEILPPGVETRAEATERLVSYKPDPLKYPVPRTIWDGKPDFSGVYWPGANVTPSPVSLESLYRPETRAYRESGGGAPGVIDWRGIDTPGFHCWPPSPVNGSMTEPIQLVSAPGFLVMINETVGNFRIIPIVAENERRPPTAYKPSFQGDSVGHWEGDTLVVNVTNFNGKPWLGTARPPAQPPQTSYDALHVIERWSRPDGQTLDFQVVVDDPKMLTGRWTGPLRRRSLLPYDMIQESLCMQDTELALRHREFAASEAAKRAASAR